MHRKIQLSPRGGMAMMVVLALSVVILALGMAMIGLTGNVMQTSVDAKTKIMRGKATLSFGDAKISTGERVVVLLDHDAKGVMKTLEVRLAER